MLTIIIGALIACLLFWWIKEADISDEDFITFFVFLLLVLGSFVLGIFAPIQGYKDEAIFEKEIELVSLNNTTASEGSGGLFYVSVSGENVYSYRYEIVDKYGISGKSYKVGTVSKNVTEIESKDCSKPVLRVYKRKPKRGIWTFAIGSTITEYVFYLPEGTIVRNVKLN